MQGGASNEAKDLREQESERQARIRQGTRAINATFDGGFLVGDRVGAAADVDPNQTYFGPAGGQVTLPTPGQAPPAPSGPTFVNHRSGEETALPQAAANPLDDLINRGLYGSRTRATGFGDDFFAGRREAYENFAMPQLNDQRDDAAEQLIFSLARSGNLDGSTRGEQFGDLDKRFETGRRGVLDQARSYEMEARGGIEDARSDLISMLNVTGDASAAAKAAAARATTLSAPPAFDPIGQVFADLTGPLRAQAGYERAAAIDPRYGGRFDTGLFGNRGGSVKVTA